MTFVSYAQNFEDVILWRALKHVDKGFYIDIGAQDPVVDSVSLAFYEHGWRGVHVEPNPIYAKAIKQARPDEMIMQAAIGGTKGKIGFYDIADTGLSTGEKSIAEKHKAAGFKVRKVRVDCIPMCEILNAHKEKEIHWLKIDVEGMEQQVIESWHPSPMRPWIVVVESTKPNTPELNFEAWEPQLKKLGYNFVYFDGLNRFYVSRKHRELKASFGPGPNYFDNYLLRSTVEDSEKINKLQDELKTSSSQIKEVKAERDLAHDRAMMADVRTLIVKGCMVKIESGIFGRWGMRWRESAQVFKLGRRNRKIKLTFANPTKSKTLAIEIPAPISPRQLGIGKDDRSLGLGLKRMEIRSTLDPADRRLVSFSKTAIHGVTNEVVGLSTPEDWGAWSLGDVAAFEFSESLPEKFDLYLEAFAFGPNVGKTFIAHLFNSNRDEVEADDRNPVKLTRYVWLSISSVFPEKLINSLNNVWGLKNGSKSNVEFMIDAQPEARAAWQKLVDNSNNRSKSQK